MPYNDQDSFILRDAGFNVPSPDELEQLELQEQERLRQEQNAQLEQQRQENRDNPTPRSIAEEKDADGNYTVQETEREEGFFTRLGETVNDVLSGKHRAEGFRQFAPDIPIKSDEEAEQERVDRLNAARRGEGNLLSRGLAYTAAGVEVTADAAVDLTFNAPATIGAALTNQDAPWLNPPEIVKKDPLGQEAYKLVQVIAPSVAIGLVAGPAAGVKTTMLLESAAETTLQRSADDLVLGREQAIKMGEFANALGYDGNQLTRDLIEGREPNARVLIAILGYTQNLGFNIGGHVFFKSLGAGYKGVKGLLTRNVDNVARVTGQSAETVTKALDDVNMPKGTALDEPHEMVDLDSAVNAHNPSKGNTYISDEALTAEVLRGSGLDDDFLSAADRAYFSNLKSLADEEGLRRVLKESTKTIRRLKSFPEDLGGAMTRAEGWWRSNRHLIDDGDYETLARNFLEGDVAVQTAEGITREQVSNVMVRPFKDGDLFKQPAVKTILKEYAVVGEEGFISAALVGEELGVRIQRMARQAMNLDDAGIDFSKVVDDLVDLHETANQFLIPLRRGKRRWAVEGIQQQRKSIRRIKDADVRGAIRGQDPVSETAAGRSFATISEDGIDAGRTLRELWDAWKTGDEAAGQTLKSYLGLISYGDAAETMTQVSNLSKVLEKQLRGGASDARKSLWYSYLVSRVRPQQASLSSNMFNLLRVPIGELIQGNNARAMGQFLGGASVWNDAWQNAARAFRKGSSVVDMGSSASKIDMDAVALAAKNKSLDALYEGVRKEMNANGASQFQKFTARVSYLQQRLANAPGQKLYARLLTAQDDFAKTIHAGQIATGRAWERHADLGGDLASLVKEEFDNVFHNGVANGKIVDEEVLFSARDLTFQSPIPRGEYANQIDKAFSALQDAAEDSAFWNWTSPFTKLSYNVLEQSGRMVVGALDAPIDVAVKVATFGRKEAKPAAWLLTRMNRYDAIMQGKMGELARQRLKSDMAFGEGWAVSVGTLAAFGGLTGNNPPQGYPARSFIIPAPWTDKGWVAISYERIDPVATPTAIIADLVQGVKSGDLTQRFFERGMNDLLSSVLISTVDKSFTTGLRDSAGFFDIRNLTSEQSLARSGATIASPGLAQVSGAYGGLARMITDWVNPYQGISKDENDSLRTFWGALSQRNFGGIGNPKLFDPLTGKPLLKNGVFESDNIFVNMLGSALGETFVPGRTQRGQGHPVFGVMSMIGYEWSPKKLTARVNGLSLSPSEQSTFSQELYSYGRLDKFMDQWVKDNQPNIRALQKAIDSGDQRRIKVLQDVLDASLTQTIERVKTEVANNGPKTKVLIAEKQMIESTASSTGTPYQEPSSGVQGDIQRILQQVSYR